MANFSEFSPDGGTTWLKVKDKQGRQIVAPEQTTLTADRAYAKGDLFGYNDLLYMVDSAIAQGGTITVGTNCHATNVSDAIKAGGNIQPVPAGSISDGTIKSTVNGVNSSTTAIPSLHTVQRWSNDFKKTFLLKGAASNSPIGETGVGEWQDPEELKTTPPLESDEIGWGWWYIAELDQRVTGVDIANDDSAKREPVYDNKYEDIVLGGYIIDTSTGYCCIRFGNTITDTENVAVGFEVTYKKNEVSVLPLQPTP